MKKANTYLYVRHPAIADSRIIGYDTQNVTFIYEREGKTNTVVMDKYEFIHNVIKHIPDNNFKMVRYFGIHARRSKKSVRIVMEKLGLVVNYKTNPFSWRKNIKEYTGKDPLKCSDCGGEMLLYKVVYINKSGELREYGGIDIFIKKLTRKGIIINEKEEKQKKTRDEETSNTKYYQVCLC